VIVGLASFGKAVYEEEYNGGTGSNGLTSARHDLFSSIVAEKFPETYDSEIPREYVYTGSLKLDDVEPESGMTYGKLLLSPTRTYAPVVKKILDKFREQINGMVHCSGGGQTKILHFINGLSVIKDNMFPVPPLFRAIQRESGTEWKEMYKVFNMGHRLEIYTNCETAAEIILISESFGIDARIVGRVEESKETETIIKSQYGTFRYVK
jgi:phosphoribosylformylglycinamidine cyclo-ligase